MNREQRAKWCDEQAEKIERDLPDFGDDQPKPIAYYFANFYLRAARQLRDGEVREAA